MKILKLIFAGLAVISLSACGGGGGSSTSTPTTTAPTPPAPTNKVEVSGQLTYDRVPHAENANLDYANTVSLPIRGTLVEAINRSGDVLASTISGPDGRYRLSLDAGADVRLQVKAQLLADGTATWNFQITDNTQQNIPYVLQGSFAATGTTTAQTRNLHAPHGWTGQSYGGERAAAPFAILDSVYSSVQAFVAVDPNIQFPTLELRWSPNNSPVFGDRSLGQIGSSSYVPVEDSGAIYLLGHEDADTDEFDQHVIIHEWGHYFEHQLSRRDTIGGLHAFNDRLDPRVAFSEGWSNALSAIITGDPIYRDSSGSGQSSGFSYDIENAEIFNPGWFNEASVSAIIYDIYDTRADEFDGISAGLGPLYKVLSSEALKQSSIFTTIFTLADGLRSAGSIGADDMNTLMEGHAISGEGPNGNGESNNGAIQSALPVYKEVIANDAPVQFCTLDDAGVYNKLGNRDFIFLNLPADIQADISVMKVSGADNRDPDFNIWQAGQLLHESSGSETDQERFRGPLKAGAYILEVFDYRNINGFGAQRGDSCYDLSVQGQ